MVGGDLGIPLQYWQYPAARTDTIVKEKTKKCVSERACLLTECHRIWNNFLATGADMLVNVDSKSHKITEGNMGNPDRWTFDVAAAHLYYLMTSDSYSRSFIIYSQGDRKGGGEEGGLGPPNFWNNENKSIFNKRTIKVCVSGS